MAKFDSFDVEGAGQNVLLRKGAVATVLLHVARRFNYEVAPLRSGDLNGGSWDRRVNISQQSNFLSGTAMEIRSGDHPLDVANGYFDFELIVIRDILAECNGVVEWGGDFDRPLEGYFGVSVLPGSRRLSRLAASFGYEDTFDSSRGVGAIDAYDPARLARARRFHRRS